MNLPKKIIESYGISETDDSMMFLGPAMVRVYKDDQFNIEEREAVFDISNSKISVSIWKDTYLMQVVAFH